MIVNKIAKKLKMLEKINLDMGVELMELYNQAMQENNEKILDMVEKDPNAKILDLGCGSGVYKDDSKQDRDR